MAGEKGLDLIEVNPVAKPPVAKIIEYGKFSYEQRKKEKKARVHQKSQTLKQVRIKFKTSDHDQKTKAKQVEKFLVKGNKVRVEIFLRGREKTHRELAKEKLKTFLEIISEEYRVLEEIKNTPRGLAATIMQ